MPHQCVRCSAMYADGSHDLLKGCGCGGKLFFFIKKEKLEEAQKAADSLKLSQEEKHAIEEDVFEMLSSRMDHDAPVVLDLEAVRVLKPGQYELDLVHLFHGQPLIYRLEEGKYVIDLVESFHQLRKDKES
ncbi:MAG: Zn-ribbon containing protein [Nanoarchaeota archaeon]